jgi:hypothetical protein
MHTNTKRKRKKNKKKVKHGGGPTKKRRITTIPQLIIPTNETEDLHHIHINLLIDLMGSSLYDAFIYHINQTTGLNIGLISYPKSQFESSTNTYIKKTSQPCIFYQSGGDYTHFICTYDSKFEECSKKINASETISEQRARRNICKLNKNCLWDPYYNLGGSDCTIYAGFQKQAAHSFCQTFTLSCMIHQYMPDYPLIQDFSLMKSVTGIEDISQRNEILIMNAYYAKQIACNIIKHVYNNDLKLYTNGGEIDFWDFLYEQIGSYVTTSSLNVSNYGLFIDYFIQYCENITIEEMRNSTISQEIME